LVTFNIKYIETFYEGSSSKVFTSSLQSFLESRTVVLLRPFIVLDKKNLRNGFAMIAPCMFFCTMEYVISYSSLHLYCYCLVYFLPWLLWSSLHPYYMLVIADRLTILIRYYTLMVKGYFIF
jgi:hypothetical protein